MFPENDEQFEDSTISRVDGDREHGWTVAKADSWCIGVQKDSPVVPEAGMSIRLYGEGIGSAVRGMFLNGKQVYYRTKEQDEEHRAIELYGADAADWLKRWDDGRSCWSLEMGGLGPGYEQAIQVTVAEILRHMLDAGYHASRWTQPELWKQDREKIEQAGFANERIEKLGLSGAQWGAALNLAAHLYQDGPRKIMTDERVKDRKIQVSRTFPG
jgi:hypothetical protein